MAAPGGRSHEPDAPAGRRARVPDAPAAASQSGDLRAATVHHLQRTVGNRAVQALLRPPVASAAAVVQRESPKDVHEAVAVAEKSNDPMDVIRTMDRPDFGQATDDERITLIRITNRLGGGDPARLGRLWNSFPEARLPAVVTKYMSDWETSARLWPGVPDLVSAVPKIVDAFRGRLRAEAEANLSDNAEYVRKRMEQLGYAGAEATLTGTEQKELRQRIQATAYHLHSLVQTQERAKRIEIGRTVGRISTPVTFDPAGPDVLEMPKSVDKDKWAAIKKEWDDAQKPLSEAAANHPELYELLSRPDRGNALLEFSRITPEDPGNRPGTSDGATPGHGYQTQAKNLLTSLSTRIDTARKDLGNLDMLELPALHSRVYAAPGTFAGGMEQWVAKRAVERHQRDAHTLKVLSQMGEGGALLVATIASGGFALALTAVGTGAGVAHAAIDYAEAHRLENLARATPKKGTELVTQAQADAKMVEAGAELFAAAIAVIAAAGMAWAAAVEARLVSRVEKLVADQPLREALLAKVADKRTLLTLLGKADSPAELRVLLDAVDAGKAGQLLDLRAAVRTRAGNIRSTYGAAIKADAALEREVAEAEEMLKDAQKAEDAAKKLDGVVDKALAPLRALVPDEALFQKLLTRAGDPGTLAMWLRTHESPAKLEAALDAIWTGVPDAVQRTRLMDIVKRPESLAKYLTRVSNPAELEAAIANTRATGVPGGIDAGKWRDVAARVRAQAGGWGGRLMVQGSRAVGVAADGSDLDFAILMDQETYDQALVKAFKTTPQRIAEMRRIPAADYKSMVAGKERGLWYSANKGKIARGELKLSSLGKSIEKELELKKDVDMSAILEGGDLDQGPYLPLP